VAAIEAGLQSVRKGTTLVGHRAVPHLVISTVTDVFRWIDGASIHRCAVGSRPGLRFK